MNKFRKIIITFVFITFALLTIMITIRATTLNNIEVNVIDNKITINPDTNFFAKNITEQVEEVVDDSSLADFTLVASNSNISLYLKEDTLSIALYDKQAKYIWYSYYKDYNSIASNDIKNMMISGVSIVCFDSSTLNKQSTKYASVAKDCTKTYEYNDNGFRCNLNFTTMGVSFSIEVSIDNNKLTTFVDLNSLEEKEIKLASMKNPKQYKLHSITLFPYFGSENYKINGYAFIPDGSGALIRYTNESYDTAFIKSVYGKDLGLYDVKESEYLKKENTITMPIYGINHGYNQAAFLACINEGYGSAELNSYPYNYSNIPVNTTFFKYILRDTLNISVSSGNQSSINIINKDVYSKEFKQTYTFLNGSDASYSGMARTYRNSFGFKQEHSNEKTLLLSVVGMDYKNGLFGKNYQKFTTYKQLQNIMADLNNNIGNSFSINYMSSLKNGYYDNAQGAIKPSSTLGGKKDFLSLLDYANDIDVDIYYYLNPLIAKTSQITKQGIKKHNLQNFNYDYKSSLELNAKILNPIMMADYFNKNSKSINKYDIKNFTFEYLGSAAFSYRSKGSSVSRTQMINQIVEEVKSLGNYNLSLYEPNDYLFSYINNYLNAPVESSRYSFITDSIPFIQIVLSGNVNLYSKYYNYVSNKNLFTLRLIEYNIYPSFILTASESNKLRYTNYEYLFSTCYDDFRDSIISTYNTVSSKLSNVIGCNIVDHLYIANGISKTTYSNNVSIYVNYNDTIYDNGIISIPPYDSIVVGGNM